MLRRLDLRLVAALSVVLLGCGPPQLVDSDRESAPAEALADARGRLDAGQIDAALSAFGKLTNEHPESVEAARGLQDALRASMLPGDYRHHYEQLLAARPDDSLSLYLWGRARIDDPEVAMEAFRKAAEADPLNPWPVIGQAYLLSQRGDLFGTISVYEAAVERAPRSFLLRLFLGVQYLDLKLFVKARRQLDTAERLRPDDPRVWAAQGKLAAAGGQYERALELLLRVRAEHPRSADIYPTLASLYLRRREPVVAEEMYRRGLELGLAADEELYGQIRAAKLVEGIE